MGKSRTGLKILRILVLFAAYFVTAKFGLALGAVSGFATLVWPPTGIAMAALLTYGLDLWPGILMAAFLANFDKGAPWHSSFGVSIGNTLEAVVGTYLLRHMDFDVSLRRIQDVIKFVVVAALFSPIISASIGVLSLVSGGAIPSTAFGNTWEAWWLGDMIGSLVVAPFLLVWKKSIPAKPGPKRTAEAVVLILVAVFVCTRLFPVLPFPGPIFLSHTYFIFPVILWAAMRFQQKGAVTMVLLVSALSVWGTAAGNGPFVSSELSASLVHLQTFVSVVAITTLVLAAAVTERNTTESALIEALQQRDDFLSVASHELRTPVTALHLRLQLLQEVAKDDVGGEVLPKKLSTSLLTFEQATLRLITLLDKLLDVTRIRVGKLELHREPLDLSTAVREVVARFAEEAEQARTTINVNAAGPVQGSWDLGRIEQVVTNLVSNAIKYGECRPIEIHVGLDSGRGVAVLKVADQGMGIPPELQPRIFKRFERAAEPTRIPGLGLGLYISRQIVNAHGGSIDVKSDAGKGSVFTVDLPLS